MTKSINLTDFPARLPCLTLWPEWTYPITEFDAPHAKDIENRFWRPPEKMIGQWFGIHAGKTIGGGQIAEGAALNLVVETASFAGKRWDRPGYSEPMDYFQLLRSGDELLKVMSQIRRHCETRSSGIVAVARLGVPIPPPDEPKGWHMVSQWGFPLLDVVRLPEIVRCGGAQKFWRATEEITSAVYRRLVRLNSPLPPGEYCPVDGIQDQPPQKNFEQTWAADIRAGRTGTK